MNFVLQYSPQAKEGINKLSKAGLKRLAEKAFLKLSADPYSGKKLVGKLQGLYSARITRRFRIIYQIVPDKSILLILDISHRRGQIALIKTIPRG